MREGSSFTVTALLAGGSQEGPSGDSQGTGRGGGTGTQVKGREGLPAMTRTWSAVSMSAWGLSLCLPRPGSEPEASGGGGGGWAADRLPAPPAARRGPPPPPTPTPPRNRVTLPIALAGSWKIQRRHTGWENQVEIGCLLKKRKMLPTYVANELLQVYDSLLMPLRGSDAQATSLVPIALQHWHSRPSLPGSTAKSLLSSVLPSCGSRLRIRATESCTKARPGIKTCTEASRTSALNSHPTPGICLQRVPKRWIDPLPRHSMH